MKSRKLLASPRGNVAYVDDSHVVFECGSGLVVFDLENPGSIDTIANSCEHGVSAFTVNAFKGIVAFAPRTSPPPIHVLKLPENEIFCSLVGGARLEYEKLALSRRADCICAVSGITENRLYVYNVRGANIMAMAELPGTNIAPFANDFISMNPGNSQMVCSGGKHGIAFWKVKTLANDTKISVIKAASIAVDGLRDSEHEAEEFEDTRNQGDASNTGIHSTDNNFIAHSWGTENQVFAANLVAMIAEFDAIEGVLRRRIVVQELSSLVISTLVVLTEHLVVACSDGSCRWLHTHKMGTVEFTSGLGSTHGDTTVSIPDSSKAILACCPSPSYNNILFVTRGGNTHLLSIESIYEGAAPELATCLLESHSDPVTGICETKLGPFHTSHTVTASIDGTIRLWDTTMTQRGRYHFWSEVSTDSARTSDATSVGDTAHNMIPITAIASSPHHPLLGIGLAPGTMYFMHLDSVGGGDVSDPIEIVPLTSLQLYKHPVTIIAFHPTEMIVAVASGLEEGTYIIDVNPNSKHVFNVITYAVPSGDTVSLTWHDKRLLIFMSSGSVAYLDIPDLDNVTSNLDPLEPSQTIILDNKPLQTTPVNVNSQEVYLYAVVPGLPHVVGYELKSKVLEIVFQNPEKPHTKGLLCLHVCDDGTKLATGDADGTLVVWQFCDGADGRKLDIVAVFPRVHDGAIICVRFIHSGNAVCSAGLDSAVFVFSLTETTSMKSCEVARPASSFSPLVDHARHLIERPVPLQRPTHRQLYLTRQAEAHSLDAQAQKAVRYNIIADLRHRLNELLTKNDQAPDLEKLDRSEFVIDCRGRDCILDANKNRVAEIRDKLDAEDMQRDQVSSNIKRDCWDSMEVHATECRALLREKMAAVNFPLSNISQGAERQMECVCNFRKLELRDIALRNNLGFAAWPGRADMVPPRITWIINEGQLRAGTDNSHAGEPGWSSAATTNGESETDHQESGRVGANSFAEEEEEEGELHTPDVETINADSLYTQVYPPAIVITTNQKRSQILLISKLIRDTQTKFNSQFSKLHHLKRDELEKIEEKNLRVCSILNELNSDETYFKPQLSRTCELPETILTTSEDEINVEPYEGAKTHKTRPLQGGNDLFSENTVNKWDMSKRALEDMMYGTLDTKRDVDILKVELQPPEWLEGQDSETLTEEQQRELLQYENALKLLEEEREKHRKALELELKKLKTEIHDIARTFDEKLKLLVEERVRVMGVSATQEFYMLRMSVSILEKEWALHMASTLKKKEIALRAASESKELEILYSKESVDGASQRVDALQNEDRQLERNFRRDLQMEHTVDQDMMRSILIFYRYRNPPMEILDASQPTTPGKKAQALASSLEANIAVGQYARHDPFFHTTKDDAEKNVYPLQNDLEHWEPDLPDGLKLDAALLNSTRELRQRKLNKEAEITQAEASLLELKKQLSDMMRQGKSLENEIQEINTQQINYASMLMLAERNIDLLVRLKQGQDEVEQEAVVTDYSDAVLIPVGIVHGVNNEIRRLGAEQTKVLIKIKHFRKSINYMDWENQYMQEQAHDLEEYYTDLQLLHVTKNLQSIMKGDPGKREREHTMKVESRIKMMGVVHDENCAKFKHANAKLAHQVRDRDEENDRLKQQLKELEGSVIIRESILKSHVENHGGELNPAQQAANSMKRIILRRRLIDLVRM